MKDRFIELWRRIGTKGNPGEIFETLDRLYSEENRYYHNWNHIRQCLDEFSSVRDLTENPDAVEFALWFHDAVYNTREKDNEEKSAILSYNVCMQSGLSGAFAEAARDLVLVTKHINVPECVDERLVVDIDLSILGKPVKEFDEYEKNIRKEYSWVPEDRFREGRREILQRFLDRPAIYLTDFFVEKYEAQARKNLERSIRQLSS